VRLEFGIYFNTQGSDTLLLRVGTQNMSIIATRRLEKVPIQEIIKCDFDYEPR